MHVRIRLNFTRKSYFQFSCGEEVVQPFQNVTVRATNTSLLQAQQTELLYLRVMTHMCQTPLTDQEHDSIFLDKIVNYSRVSPILFPCIAPCLISFEMLRPDWYRLEPAWFNPSSLSLLHHPQRLCSFGFVL